VAGTAKGLVTGIQTIRTSGGLLGVAEVTFAGGRTMRVVVENGRAVELTTEIATKLGVTLAAGQNISNASSGSGDPCPEKTQKHTPGRGHQRKSQPAKKERFADRARKKREAAEAEYQVAVERWNRMSPEARNLRKDLDPANLKK
jgi:hypothetical protein